jgi:hypothetical protein
MDLTQSKLTKKEWETIETPISSDERKILKMIISGYDDVNIHSNNNMSMFSFVKIDITPEIEIYLYQKYFSPIITLIVLKYNLVPSNLLIPSIEGLSLKRLKSADNIRLQNLEINIGNNRPYIFEFLLIDLASNLLKNLKKNQNEYAFYLYTLIQLKKSSIHNINQYVTEFIDNVIQLSSAKTNIGNIIHNSYEFIEKNNYLLQYEDLTLFSHQKDLFSICKQNIETPKLILYTAPTGTGKTLSPIGLSNQYRIIFVCVARHVGLALAKSAVSMEKKVAFAFGCETASDIRLHYFAATNYVKNSRSGAIAKVDNSQGQKVEIMICDVQSYLTAMYYMLSFNDVNNIITYWDEPTITMDYKEHDLHKTIKRNWSENKIPKLVLSCATLPKEHEIMDVICDFRSKFENANIHNVTSFDCKKSIPILNKDSYSVLPHTYNDNYKDLIECVDYCSDNKTLLRYFDLREIIRFIEYINTNQFADEKYNIDSYFSNISEITMNSLKCYYLLLLKHIHSDKWCIVYEYMKTTQQRKFTDNKIVKSKSMDNSSSSRNNNTNVFSRTVSMSSVENNAKPVGSTTSNGILLTTSDAYTLTDGPTIFLTEDVKKIGSFYIQQSNISASVFQNILSKITKNNEIAQKIEKLESIITEKQNKSSNNDDGDKPEKSGKDGNDVKMSKEIQKMMEDINNLRREIRIISLNPMYIPNTIPHQNIWTPNGNVYENAFLPTIDEDTTKSIMALDIENNLKVLLLLGIGMFMEKPNIQYMEIMKRLADTQKLFIIIASSDYIYGTNYQFCHGIIGKDLTNMTQQKTLQSMGRIGRNKIQQDYTVRFRDDEMIKCLFKKPDYNIEAENMIKLFTSD